jgi:hypothetical protein
MPGVRYGPDITDDAAEILDFVKDVQARMRKGLKINKRESTRYDKFKDVADKLFGVKSAQFDKGKFGDLAILAQYGGAKPRSKLAKSWRTGGQMKKSVTQEFVDRGVPGGRKAGSTKKPGDAWYLGRTNPKQLREVTARAQRRANRNGVSFGKTVIKPRTTKPDNFLANIDKLNIAKARTGSSDIANRPLGVTKVRKPGAPIRPPLPKSAITAAKRAAKGTKAARDLAGKGKKKTGGTRKK